MKKKHAVLIEEDPQEEERSSVLEAIEEQKELEKIETTDEWVDDFQSRFSDQPVRIVVEKYDIDGDWCYCRRYALNSFDLEVVKRDFGGGKYRASLVDEKGKYIKTGRRQFKLSDLIVHEKVEKDTGNPLENPVVAMIIKSMEAQNHTLLELTKSIISGNASQPRGLGEVLEAVKTVNAMSPKTEKPLDSFKETLGLMKLVKEVTGDEASGEKEGSLLSDLKEVLEVLPALKEQLGNLKAPGTPVALPNPQPGTTYTEVETAPMDPLTKKVIELVPKFVGGAKSNAPIDQWANYLLELMDSEVMPILLPELKAKYKPMIQDEDDAYEMLIKYAKDPEERENIFKRIPPLAPYKTWCLKVMDEAVKLLETPEPPEVPEAPEGSNAVLSAVNGHDED